MSKHFDIIISGGGMVGMAMAVAVARFGVRVAVVERSEMRAQLDEHFDGRVCAISLGSQKILDAMGVWEAMIPHAQAIDDIRVSDGDQPFYLHYDHRDVGDAPFGYIVENRHTRHALHKAASTFSNITIIDNMRVESIVQESASVAVSLSNGDVLRASLLIGADGKQSMIRKLVNIGQTQWSYDQVAIVTTIEHEMPHHGLAQERFLPAGPFAVLPMTGNRSSLVWVEPADRVQIYMELPEEEFVQEITERVGGYLGAIKTQGKRFTYPLMLMHAKKYGVGRVMLMGDAAHGMHPIAGQGVNVGFRDVAALAELIENNYKLGMDIAGADVLAAYERWRTFDNVSMLAVTDMLTRLFSNNIVPLRIARDVGLWMVEKNLPLKRFFMKHAMGLVGDVPRVLQRKK